MSVLIVGSIALDSIETPWGKMEDALGGSSTYISLAASYFIDQINVVGVVGDDFPQEHIQMLKEHNVDLEGLQIEKGGKTFRWAGKYYHDTNNRDTLDTQLNVFEHFDPIIPEKYKSSEFLCLGNIDPILQKRVLERINRPKLVICDTMNFWIKGKNAELRETLKLVDIVILNDSEAKLLAGETNLIKAAKYILGIGPRAVIIKKGEHGAILVTPKTLFAAPAYPLEDITDPTGAGDTFAGGFIGWLAKTNDTSDENLKKAILYGSSLASFCCEKFSVESLKELTQDKIQSRYNEFVRLSKVEA